MLHTWDNLEQRVESITRLEHQGDTFTHEIVAQLHSTFITPFDREDIALLAHSLDDITDHIEAAADAMLVYKVQHPTERARELADVLVLITQEVERAVSEMRHRVERAHVLKRCVEINRLENMGDRVYRAAMAELFGEPKNIASIIKWREIYEYMETAADRCEDVADVLEGVALKYS